MITSSTFAATPAPCWNCSAITGAAHFCAACKKIQPSPSGTDHFIFFDLPQRLDIDLSGLEQRFHSLSWKLHPDHFAGAPDFERQISLEQSSRLNDAYRTLRDPLLRVEYLLHIAGLRSDGQKKQQAPAELLEEVFELNESLDELRGARRSGGSAEDMAGLCAEVGAALPMLEESLARLDRQLAAGCNEWDLALDAGAAPAKQELLARMNDILNRRSYIRNLVESTQKALQEA